MYDTIIVGNGIAGMTAAIYAKRANLNFKIVGEDEYSVGQIENAVLVENYPGIKGITGYDLGNSIKEQMEEIGIVTEEKKVVNITKIENLSSEHFVIEYEDGTEDEAITVAYALGAKHRPLSDICPTREDVLYHYCAICDGALYKGKKVAIIGGGNSAFTEAIYLSNIASSVTIITDRIVADNILQQKVADTDNIFIYNGSKLTEITKEVFITPSLNGDKEEITNDENIVIYFDSEGKNQKKRFDGLFSAIGMIPQSQCCPSRVEQTYGGFIIANEMGETNVDGFYAIGDIRHKMLRQAITAAADGANCISAIEEYLRYC